MATNGAPEASRLSDQDFSTVVRLAPLVSIDLIILDAAGRALLGLRTNEPAKSYLFVPGGAIRKGERLDDAFERILKVELGWAYPRSEAAFVDAYEHHYETNRYGHPSYTTHYVVLAYRLNVAQPAGIGPDDQHDDFRWMTPSEILSSVEVHENTKAYFR